MKYQEKSFKVRMPSGAVTDAEWDRIFGKRCRKCEADDERCATCRKAGAGEA